MRCPDICIDYIHFVGMNVIFEVSLRHSGSNHTTTGFDGFITTVS